MKSVLIVTFIDFWASGAGHRARLSALVNYLQNHVEVTIAFVGPISQGSEEAISAKFPAIRLIVLEKQSVLRFSEYGERLRNATNHLSFDATIIEYLQLAFMLTFIKNPGTKILDTHDILNEKIASFKESGLPYSGIRMTRLEEFELYAEFDLILAIQEADQKTISAEIGQSRTLLVPHATQLRKQKLRENLTVLGFLGSEYPPNVHGIKLFLDEIWPSLHSEFNLSLKIFGNVCTKLYIELPAMENHVEMCGFVQNLSTVYDTCDVIINPVRTGAGLKIKNVEAIGSGLPLITSSHGATGLEAGVGKFLLVADQREVWISHMQRLVNDFSFRKSMGDHGFTYSQQYFSPEACFSELLKRIG